MTTDSGRIGFCCGFVSPDGDADEERRMNMRTVTMAWLAKAGPAAALAKLAEVVAHNLDTLDRQLAYVAALPADQHMFRLMSGIMPGWSHPVAMAMHRDLEAEIQPRLAAAGAFARANDIRLSMHPAQHAILATHRPEALANAIGDVMDHVFILDAMGYGGGWHRHGAHINIHGGAASAGVEGLRAGLAEVPAEARELLAIENDEFSFGLDDLLEVADDVALVIDFHHHWIKSRGAYLAPDDPRIARIVESWRGVRPVAHISVSREALYSELLDGEVPDFARLAAAGFKAGALRGHSAMMWNRRVNDMMAAHLAWCDIEVEAKSKNLAAAQLAAHVRGLEGTARAA